MDQYVVKNPGHLPTGYGRESDTNMFHGSTLFRDAASKREFEEWLYEEASARLAVKHYHSNNGVFNAGIFTESCEEDGQTQSFSGIGAQHQN